MGAASGARGIARAATGAAAVSTRKQATMSGLFERDWLRKEPIVGALGFLGWTIPSNIKVGSLGDASLFGKMMESIGEELQHFPTGPGVHDDFWLYMITWHIGLFSVMTLGQIGWQGRKQGFF